MVSNIQGRYPMPVLNFTITCDFWEELIIAEIKNYSAPVNKVSYISQTYAPPT